jgi:hypothetical protein
MEADIAASLVGEAAVEDAMLAGFRRIAGW